MNIDMLNMFCIISICIISIYTAATKASVYTYVHRTDTDANTHIHTHTHTHTHTYTHTHTLDKKLLQDDFVLNAKGST